MTAPPRPVVLATQNPGKIAELRRLFAEARLEHRFPVRTLDEYGGPFPEPEEGSGSFLENATLKAVTYARLTGHLCLADDSGLEVDALDGAPGVISSHYYSGGEDRGDPRDVRDPANNARLLGELEGVPPEARTARFVCTMVLASPEGNTLATSRGTFEGRIGRPSEDDVPRGAGGFGYDPLFLVPPDYTRTSSELAPDEKNRLSHRGEALRQMIEHLRALAD
ncbi:MAG: non-canonical purine NTP pyrophosphatase [Phycisphaerales bacterium JB040]